MSKRKNKKRYDELGVKEFKFDYQLERIIYCYLCHIHITRRKLRALNKLQKFECYEDWKQYICVKYKRYNRQQLLNFSRYLNHRLRNNEPVAEYFELCIPISVSFVFLEFIDFHIQNASLGSIYIAILLLFLFYVIIKYIVKLLWDNNTDKYFLTDYKKIIDELIENKNS